MPKYTQMGRPPPRPTTFTAPISSQNDRDDYIKANKTYWGNAFESYLSSLGMTYQDLSSLGSASYGDQAYGEAFYGDQSYGGPPERSFADIMAGFNPFQWGFTFEVDTLTYEEVLQNGSLAAGFGGASVLYLVWGPENMNSLDFLEELDAWLSSSLGDQMVVAFNPEWAATQALVQQGGFSTVIMAGHGDQGNAFMVDEQGEAMTVPVSQLAEIFEGTGVQNVFLNICEGMAGVNGISQKLRQMGINVLGWARKVSDSDAASAVEMLVAILDEMNADNIDIAHLNELARRFDGDGGNLVVQVGEWSDSGGSLEDLYGIFSGYGNPSVDLYSFLQAEYYGDDYYSEAYYGAYGGSGAGGHIYGIV